ncbi:tumor necrosis factor receptor superfamily member 25 isoform X2 [Rana temporaria]|uniref:tumor necrosis factor receptor superfamily member 25 isoform X2 n=1 Tax=Rana temporaria TaxID=8407 RepID=UPI001AACE480|nr:tumor necrosis factor receptor superfamily member 25 isoform X2 [Rana temporaria]
MKNTLFLLLMSWVYLLLGNPIHTLEDWNQTRKTNKFNFSSEEGLSRSAWSKHGRYKRSSTECPEGQGYDGVRCCRKCPKGQYVEKTCNESGEDRTCAVCREGTHLAHPNYNFNCIRCAECVNGTQVEVVPCTPITNRQCKCKEGYYGKGGGCHKCSPCPNRNIKEICSNITDTVCGTCLPDFFEEKNECRPCNESNKDCTEMPAACTPLCVPMKADTKDLNLLLVILPVLLLLGALSGLFIYKYKFKEVHSLGAESFTTVDFPLEERKTATSDDLHIQPGLCQEEAPISSKTHPEESILLAFDESPVPELCSASDSQGQVPSVLQKGCALYDIIDCVPVKRWKELMRNLELSDNEIERVEMEVGNFRDQQYEMLRRWCQFKTSSMECVYQALDRMQLSGCLEKLRSKIEQYC